MNTSRTGDDYMTTLPLSHLFHFQRFLWEHSKGGGIPLSAKLKGQNKIKESKLTRFHHVPASADKIPEHYKRKVRSLGELLDWHDRVCTSAASTYQVRSPLILKMCLFLAFRLLL